MSILCLSNKFYELFRETEYNDTIISVNIYEYRYQIDWK